MSPALSLYKISTVHKMTGEAYPCEKWYGGILNKYPMNNSFISRGPATSNISEK